MTRGGTTDSNDQERVSSYKIDDIGGAGWRIVETATSQTRPWGHFRTHQTNRPAKYRDCSCARLANHLRPEIGPDAMSHVGYERALYLVGISDIGVDAGHSHQQAVRD